MSKFIAVQKWIFKGRECDPNPHLAVIDNETIVQALFVLLKTYITQLEA